MHELGGADDGAAEGCSDGLVTEANAEDGSFACHVLDKRNEDACFLGSAGTGREQDAVGLEGGYFFN